MDRTSTTDYRRLTQQLHRAERSLHDGRRQPVPLSVLRQAHQQIDRLLAASASVVADAVRVGTTPEPGIGSWTAEAARLRDARERHRFAVADMAGLLLPTTVQPASLAATGPHIAGMGFGPADPLVASEGQPRIGIELATVLDAVSGSPTSTVGPPPVPVAAAPQLGPAGGSAVPQQSKRQARLDLRAPDPAASRERPRVDAGARPGLARG